MKILIVSLLLVISCVANNDTNNANTGAGNSGTNTNNANTGAGNNGTNTNNGNTGAGNNGTHANNGTNANNGNTGAGHSGDYSGGNNNDNNGNSTDWNSGDDNSNDANNTQQDCNTCQDRTQIEQFLADSSVYVAKVQIISKIDNSNGKYKDNLVRYRAQVLSVYNGCLKVKKCPIVLETSLDASGCGRPLDDYLGQQFVISFRTGSTSCKNSYAFGLCDLYVSSDLLTVDDLFLLENWKNDCLGVCSSGNEVQCLVAPCLTATPPDGCDTNGAICTDNYCNGCNALWWNDDGTLRCHSGTLKH
jgi:hypothetical protein